MKRTLKALSACALACFVLAETSAQRFALDLQGNAAYYALKLPAEVYAASVSGVTRDLRVFNASGEPVPYTFQEEATPTAAPQQFRDIRWFALPTPKQANSGAPLGVSIAPDGSLRAAAMAQPPASRDGDVVDVSHVSGTLTALIIHVQAGFQGSVMISASSDLRDWQEIASGQLLNVRSGQDVLSQERVELGGVQARYLRLRWPDGAPLISAIAVEAQTGTATPPPQRIWREGITARAGKVAGEYLFDSGGRFPVERFKLSLPQPNTVAKATLYSRGDAQAPWREISSAPLYRLSSARGSELSNPALEIPAPNTDREWRLMVDMRNGGLGSGMPVAALGWLPDTLTFVARGEAPFSLAVGQESLAGAAISRTELIVNSGAEIGKAQLGKPLPPLPVDTATKEDPDAKRRYILWGALLLAVAALGVMAWHLARGGQMGQGGSSE